MFEEVVNKSSEMEVQEKEKIPRTMKKMTERYDGGGGVCLRKVSVDLNIAALFTSVQRGDVFPRSYLPFMVQLQVST